MIADGREGLRPSDNLLGERPPSLLLSDVDLRRWLSNAHVIGRNRDLPVDVIGPTLSDAIIIGLCHVR